MASNRYRVHGLESDPTSDPAMWYQDTSGIWKLVGGSFGTGKAPLGTATPDVQWGAASGGGGGGGGGGAPTTPGITGQVWFKADAGITVDGSNQPTAMTNHGSLGGTFTLDATAANRGVLVSAAQNGLAALRMDGTNDSFVMNLGSTITSVHMVTFIAMKRRSTGASPRSLMSFAKAGASASTSDGRGNVYHPDANTILAAWYVNGNEIYQSLYNPGGDGQHAYSPQILEVGRDGDRRRIGYNGKMSYTQTGDTRASAAMDIDRLIFGAWSDGSGNPTGYGLTVDLFEIIVAFSATAFSHAAIELTRAYLAGRWAIPIQGSSTPAGTGASSSSFFGPTGPRTLPPTSGWVWDNQASSVETISSRDGSINIDSPPNGANQYTARLRALPASPRSVIANIRMAWVNANYQGYGLGFGNSGGTEIKGLYVAAVDNRVDVYVATTSGRAWGAAHVGPIVQGDQPEFLGLYDDGTNHSYWIGEDEEHMTQIFSHARTTGLTPATWGFFTVPRQASYRQKVTLWSWKESGSSP